LNRLFFAAIAIAGCAGAAPAQTETPAPAGVNADAAADASTSPSTSTSPVAEGGVAVTPAAMKPPTPTAYAADLEAIGLDPQHLPPLNKIAPEQLRKVMPLVAKSLGVKCNACHDFNAPVQPAVTPRMKVAQHMWNDFVRIRTIEGGSVFCDSCHHGALDFLDRRDRPALEHWMDESFVKALGAERCETCHGTPPRWKFIDVWRH
jgi:hypothetical protein